MSISIGIPFYNAEEFLIDAIRSIFAQSYQEWELILVDDGSTDKSLEIAQSIKDPRVRVISDGENRKLSYRLNQITNEAKYEFVARMDADDLISPDKFKKQIYRFEANPEVDLVTTGVCSITNNNIPVGFRCGTPSDEITGRKLILGQHPIVHAAILGRKSWFLRNPYDEKLLRAQDYELWIRSFYGNDLKIGFVHEPLYYYREEFNVTSNRLLRAYAIQRQMYKKYGIFEFSKLENYRLNIKSHFKGAIVRILSAFNRMDILLERRNSGFNCSEDLEFHKLEIKKIFDTRVPGIDT